MGCPMDFGDLNIPTSRAFWDDCEDDEFTIMPEERLQITYENGQSESSFASDVFLLIEGPEIAHFAKQTFITNAKPIFQVDNNGTSLYFNETNKFLCAILNEDLTNSGEVTEILLPFTKQAREVITLTLKPKIEYKSEEIQKFCDEMSIVRCINGKLKNIKKLQPPNFIAGVCAGVARWRENEQMSISAYVIYTDKLPLDTIAAQPVLQLLQNLGISCSKTYVSTHNCSTSLYL